MLQIAKPGKKIKEYLSKFGPQYQLKVIDLENCIYRDLKNGYDIEISGLDNAKKKFNANVYVWNTVDRIEIVDRVLDIQSFNELKLTLDQIVTVFSAKNKS